MSWLSKFGKTKINKQKQQQKAIAEAIRSRNKWQHMLTLRFLIKHNSNNKIQAMQCNMPRRNDKCSAL